MAVVQIWEKPGREGNVDDNGIRHYKRMVGARSNDMQDGPLEISNYPLFVRYQPYFLPGESDPRAVLKTVRATQTSTPLIWDVELNYDSVPYKANSTNQQGDSGNQSQEPDFRPPVWKIGGVAHDRVWLFDVDNNPLQSSSDEPFNPPIMFPDYDVSVEISFWRTYQTAFDSVMQYQGCVNEDFITLFGTRFSPMTLHCAKYEQSVSWDNNHYTFERSVQLIYRKEGWKYKIADMGTREKLYNAATAKYYYKTIMEGQGQPSPTYIHKNPDGTVTKKQPDPATGKVTPDFLEFPIIELIPFANIFL